jgi:predicted ester cyclase
MSSSADAAHRTVPNETLQAASPAAVVRRTFEAIFAGDLAVIDEHPGLAALRVAFPSTRAAFPDFSAELVQQLADGDRVASHWVFRGTHRGDLYGLAPTGVPVQFQNLSICRVEGGRIVQYNSEIGFLSVLKQLGALPLGPHRP